MPILLTPETRLVVQGMTGREGSYHTQVMKDYGTNIVGGTSPTRGGQTFLDLPVFYSVHDAVKETGANASISVPTRSSRWLPRRAIPRRHIRF